MDENDIRLTFSYIDEFGEKTTLDKTYHQDNEGVGELWWLVEEFKCFLHAHGFAKVSTDHIVYLEEGEKVVTKDGELVIERK